MLAILSADSSVGRFDFDSLTDQTRMEMLIEGMNSSDKRSFKDIDGFFIDVCRWGIVTCSNDRVVDIMLTYREFNEEQFQFALIPSETTSLTLDSCNAHGTLDTSVLPFGLIFLLLSRNKLHGTIDCEYFPRGLVDIYIENNEFTGSMNFAGLPEGLQTLNMNHNKISGGIFLGSLPKALIDLNAANNCLSGPVDFQVMPASLQRLQLSDNALTGELRLTEFPPVLKTLSVVNNNINGTAVLPKVTSGVMLFCARNSITAVVDADGQTHQLQEKILRSQKK